MDKAPADNPSTAAAAIGPMSHPSSEFIALTLGSIGVVYGDIGTSPLYAFREAVIAAAQNGQVTRGLVLGVLSLILWALIVVVTLKYVLILLRADTTGRVERSRLPRSRRERSAAVRSLSLASA
jgi:KUP system potassium uptake protein